LLCVSAGGNIETVSITITPGCFVSNLSSLPLLMHPEGTTQEASLCIRCSAGQSEAAGRGEPGSPHAAELLGYASNQQLLLDDGGTVPLLHLWGGSGAGAAASPSGPGAEGEGPPQGSLHRRVRSWGNADIIRTFSSTGGPLQPQGPLEPSKPALRFAILAAAPVAEQGRSPYEAGPSGGEAGACTVAAATSAEPAWSSRVDPFKAAGRQRLYLQVRHTVAVALPACLPACAALARTARLLRRFLAICGCKVTVEVSFGSWVAWEAGSLSQCLAAFPRQFH
jgi:hypothetical protein